jgi:hypothetical protein
MEQAEKDFEWLTAHPEVERQYAGEWILVENEQVIAHDADLDVVLRVLESHPDALLAQAYGDEGLIF